MGDIESVRKNARLRRLTMQVELTTEFEQKLPKFIVDKYDKPSITVYPNRCQDALQRVSHSSQLKLVEHSLIEVSFCEDRNHYC